MPLPRRSVAVLLACAAPAAGALQCPEMPKQASRDTEVEVRVGVRLLGDAKGPELETRTRQLTTDLLGKVPRADRVYLEQMLFAAYCSSVRDNAALTEGEREARVLAYRREMQKALAGGGTPAATDPRDRARAELARLPVPYTPAAFHRAIQEGDLKVVRLFIAAGMDLEARNRDEWRPLQAALIYGRLDVADVLIDAGAPATGGALAQLAARGDLPRMKRLLARPASRAAIDDAWVLALSYGQMEAADLLRARGADPMVLGPRAVVGAALRYDEQAPGAKALDWLHAQGVPVDTPDDGGWTPLMKVLDLDSPGATQALLRLGADVNRVCACPGFGDGGLTPLLLAAMRVRVPMMRALLSAGARPDAVTAKGNGALHLLLERSTARAADVSALADGGVPVDMAGEGGVTPLMLAAENSGPDAVKALLDRGARATARAADGRTPLAFAALRDRDDNAALLLDVGAPLEARTGTGRTVLAIAVRNYATDTVRLLLARGARADAADRDGLTPIDHARALADNDARRAIVRLLENAAR